ncbi:MAG: hypothetical protein HXX15_07780 [Rhodopseudomonas sp.]|uniref:hypothetical protein n=1 Tax=Rhodopseudomonas sp. TaxID=1078 RepID=UPI0017F1E4A4|nr:hypothetical protein [Rhodopseudomonas sp.]NVN85976.1 hypothetical protein [Rhodopseudomonas sp.]
MHLLSSNERPFSDVDYLGIAATRVDPIYEGQEFGLHAGFLYRVDNSRPRLAHFAWHESQRDDEPSDRYLWNDINLNEFNRRFVASWLDERRNHPDKIPYGFRTDGSPYDADTGRFISPPIGQGFTCATFIVAVLRHLGFELLNEDTWPLSRTDDALWQAGIIARLRECGVPTEHVAALAQDIGARRFRPEEVCGATCLAPNWPVDFDNASAIAAGIIADIEAHKR